MKGGPKVHAAVPGRAVSDDDLALLALLARGLPLDAVARRLVMSERTVRRRTRAICDRLGVATPIEAVVWAARHHLI
jgi:DNA-binding NarL/FixJ family response regulator